MTGKKHSDAHKDAISIGTKTALSNPEVRAKISSATRGKKKHPGFGAKIALSQKGKLVDPAVGDKISASLKKAWAEGRINREKLSALAKLRSGPNHPNWICDRSKLKMSTRLGRTNADITWSRTVKRRDKDCVLKPYSAFVGECRGQLESHHILGYQNHEHLRLDVNNGVLLCLKHHPRNKSRAKRLERLFQQLVPGKVQ
jgi:hypothetical protein